MATINDVWTAYDNAAGQWSGCDWPARYGALGLNLKGVASEDAELTAERWQALAGIRADGEETTPDEEKALVQAARHLRLRGVVALMDTAAVRPQGRLGNRARRLCARVLADEWRFAASWLTEIEGDARWAQDEAREAVSAAEDSDWEAALRHAERACSIEAGYRARLPWRTLRRAIRRATR